MPAEISSSPLPSGDRPARRPYRQARLAMSANAVPR